MPVGHREHRHPVPGLPDVVVGLHPLGDKQGGIAGAGHLGVPDLAHLRRGLQVVAVAVELEPGGIRQGLAGLHAQQRLVVVRGLAGDVVTIVGGQGRDAELSADLQQPLAHALLDGQAVVHDLEEVVVRPEDLAPLGGRLQRLLVMAEPQPGLHLAGRAAGGGDDARGVLGQDLGVHPRPLAQLPLERRQRRQPEQVAQPGGVLGDHRHVKVGAARRDVVGLLPRITPGDALGVEARAGRDVGLDPDDRV